MPHINNFIVVKNILRKWMVFGCFYILNHISFFIFLFEASTVLILYSLFNHSDYLQLSLFSLENQSWAFESLWVYNIYVDALTVWAFYSCTMGAISDFMWPISRTTLKRLSLIKHWLRKRKNIIKMHRVIWSRNYVCSDVPATFKQNNIENIYYILIYSG